MVTIGYIVLCWCLAGIIVLIGWSIWRSRDKKLADREVGAILRNLNEQWSRERIDKQFEELRRRLREGE